MSIIYLLIACYDQFEDFSFLWHFSMAKNVIKPSIHAIKEAIAIIIAF